MLLQYRSRVTSPLLASASVEYLRVLASPCFVNIHNLLNDSRFSSDLYSRVKRVNKFDFRALKFCRMNLRLELKSSEMTLLGKSSITLYSRIVPDHEKKQLAVTMIVLTL